METNEVSIHLCKVFLCVKTAGGWITAKDVAAQTGVSGRCARGHLSLLVKFGLLDLAEVFPGHRYRLAEKAGKRNVSMLQRIDGACAVFGLPELAKRSD